MKNRSIAIENYRKNVSELGESELLGLYNALGMLAIARNKPSNWLNERLCVIFDRLTRIGYDITKLEAKP